MPATPTPVFLIPGPLLTDSPPDIEAALTPMRNRLEAIFMTLAAVEIGVEMPYAGSVLPDPPGDVEYAWCNGGTIRNDLYPDFMTRVGHAYNGGAVVGTGIPTQGRDLTSGPLVRLPNKAGRMSIGAGLASNPTPPGALTKTLGVRGGEETHILLSSESGNQALAWSGSGGGTFPYSPAGYGPTGIGDTGYALASNAGGYQQGGISISASGTIAARNGAPHQNLGPYEVDNWIVRIR